MDRRSPKRSLDVLAKQLHVPPLNMPEERLNALVSAGGRVKEAVGLIEYISKHSISLYIDEGNGPRAMTQEEVNDTILSFAGVSKVDADIVSNYIVKTMRILQAGGK